MCHKDWWKDIDIIDQIIMYFTGEIVDHHLRDNTLVKLSNVESLKRNQGTGAMLQKAVDAGQDEGLQDIYIANILVEFIDHGEYVDDSRMCHILRRGTLGDVLARKLGEMAEECK
jgi:hypothetical protein